MHGEIGALYQDGKQLGGFYDWTLDLSMTRLETADSRVYKVHAIKSMASRYYLFREPSDGAITANYYQLIRGKLVLMATHAVKINTPELLWMN
jgi:hypothetical protein